MGSPKLPTIKRLFAMSDNQCAYPACQVPLVEFSGTVTGEIAHIRAASKGGPRYDPSQSDDERHGFDNLLLLCGRHHRIIDSEVENHPVELLISYKSRWGQKGLVEITPRTTSVAEVLINNYQNIRVENNSGQVAINSPGAIQAGTLNLKSTKQKVTIAPPEGSVSSDLNQCVYIEYLIGKYKDYQKQDTSKQDKYKYMAIYNAVKRQFGCKWQLIPSARFDELVQFLQGKIDNSKVGRIRKSAGQKRYHSFDEHLQH